MFDEIDIFWMQQAINLAKQASICGEVPVGAVLVLENEVIGTGWNKPITKCDPTAHAEIVALRSAAEKLGNYRLLNTTLYVTLEPCLMCAGAIVHSRIKRLIHGAFDPKAGTVVSVARAFDQPFLNHRVEYQSGLLAEQCGELLTQFFQERRLQKA